MNASAALLAASGLWGGWPLVVARAASVAALLSVFGTLIFCQYVAPRAFAGLAAETAAPAWRRLRRVIHMSVAVGIVALLAWLVLTSADMADADSATQAFAAAGKVVSRTAFGHLVVLQAAALLAVAAAIGRTENKFRSRAALAFATAATLLHTGHGHAAAMAGGPGWPVFFGAMHVLGAGAWLGGLLPLLLVVQRVPPRTGALAARWFSPLGQWCIAAMVISAAFQGWVMVGSIPALKATMYGRTILAKLALFAVLLGFAWVNRYRFAPALRGAAAETARSALVCSIAWQTVAALAVVCAAAFLSQSPPPMKM